MFGTLQRVTSIDLNDLTETGWYRITGENVTNKPVGGWDDAYVLVIKSPITSSLFQFYICSDTNMLKKRNKYYTQTTFTEWADL